MQDTSIIGPNDEIDLQELFLSIWAHKLFIIFICLFGIILGGYYAKISKKKFISEAVFKIEDEKNNPFGEKFAIISGLIGTGSVNSDTLSTSTDKFNGRVFIEVLDSKLNFKADTFFNKISHNQPDPYWKDTLKTLLGWKNSNDHEEKIWQGIINVYSKNIILNQEDNGTYKVSVTHINPQRAANIANVIMSTIITNSINENNDTQDDALNYLSNTLAEALNNLEFAQSNLQTFTLENSAVPLKSFAQGSVKLDILREQLQSTVDLYDASVQLLSMIKQKKTTYENYLQLQKSFPIIDQVEFRRVFGQNEVISSWSWPKEDTVDIVKETLSDRKNRLKFQIETSQKNAERSGRAVETYARLQREVTVSEATYTVLMEQVKAQSVMANFRPDKTEIYEYASPAIRPFTPNYVLYLFLGASIGVTIGIFIALIIANSRKVYYSKKLLISDSRAKFVINSGFLRPFRGCDLAQTKSLLNRNSYPDIRNMALELNKFGANQAIFSSLQKKIKSMEVAHVLASYMQSDDLTFAVINFSNMQLPLENDDKSVTFGVFALYEKVNQVSILTSNTKKSLLESLSDPSFHNDLQKLEKEFDMIIMCADNRDVFSLLRFMEGQKVFHISVAKIKKSKSNDLRSLCRLLPIQGLLYE